MVDAMICVFFCGSVVRVVKDEWLFSGRGDDDGDGGHAREHQANREGL